MKVLHNHLCISCFYYNNLSLDSGDGLVIMSSVQKSSNVVVFPMKCKCWAYCTGHHHSWLDHMCLLLCDAWPLAHKSCLTVSALLTDGRRAGNRGHHAEDGCRWRRGHLFQAFLELNPVGSHLTARPPRKPDGQLQMQLHHHVKSLRLNTSAPSFHPGVFTTLLIRCRTEYKV